MAANPHSSAVTDEHWDQIFSPGIETLIETPRDIVRLMNVLRLTYPPVCRELNPVDFIAVEAVRVFLPELYDTIRRNPTMFPGEPRAVAVAGAAAAGRAFHDAWAAELPERLREAAQTLILRLFPAVPDFPGAVVSRDVSGNTRQELHVASPELFDAYFQFVVPETTVSNAEMDAHMSHLDDQAAFAALLLRLASERDSSGAPRVTGFLERLRDAVADPRRGAGRQRGRRPARGRRRPARPPGRRRSRGGASAPDPAGDTPRADLPGRRLGRARDRGRR